MCVGEFLAYSSSKSVRNLLVDHWYWLCVLCFLSASQILFSSYRAAPLLMIRHFDRFCAVCPQDPIGKRSFEGVFIYSVSSGHIESAFSPGILHRKRFFFFFGSRSSGILIT